MDNQSANVQCSNSEEQPPLLDRSNDCLACEAGQCTVGNGCVAISNPPQGSQKIQESAESLFREALAFGLSIGPAIVARQWDEIREQKVSQLVSRLAPQSNLKLAAHEHAIYCRGVEDAKAKRTVWGFHIQFNNGKDATFKGLDKLPECEAHLEADETITLLYSN